MRATVLLLTILALGACKRSESQPTKAGPPVDRHGFIQELDGHRAVVVRQGDVTVVIPFDKVPPGTLMIGKDRKAVPMPDRFPLPGISGGGGVCPCCVRTCGSPCEPIAMPCEPLPGIQDWPGGGFGRSFPE